MIVKKQEKLKQNHKFIIDCMNNNIKKNIL